VSSSPTRKPQLVTIRNFFIAVRPLVHPSLCLDAPRFRLQQSSQLRCSDRERSSKIRHFWTGVALCDADAPPGMCAVVGLAVALMGLAAAPAGNTTALTASLASIGFFIYGPQMLIGLIGAEVSHPRVRATPYPRGSAAPQPPRQERRSHTRLVTP
jgi:hypothetical protein